MKKFAIKAVAIAAGALAAGSALAGTVSVPGGTTNFAVEALTATTPVTTPNFVYTMGVGRPIGNGFTIINSANAGSTFGATCVIPGYAGPSTISVTLKRSGINTTTGLSECVYDVQVAAVAAAVGDTFTWALQTFATHPLVTGGTIGITVNLKDPGETSQVDNPGPVPGTLAASGRALTLTAAADTATVADVNHLSGPLFGFLPPGGVPADTTSVAAANFLIGNNSSGTTVFRMPNGTLAWDFTLHGTSIAVTVAGTFQGMATSGFAATTGLGVAPTVTATAGGTSATYTLLPSNITAGQTNTTVTNSFTSALTASLGTSRRFGVSALADVVTGADSSLAGSASWWTWGANASQLMTPFFNHNVNYITRFFFLNTGTSAVNYTTQCYTEGGNAVTNGAGGTLAAGATTRVPASSACTFVPGTPRGAVIFTINAPINLIKGTFQQISPTGADGVVTPLDRPYNQANTTE